MMQLELVVFLNFTSNNKENWQNNDCFWEKNSQISSLTIQIINKMISDLQNYYKNKSEKKLWKLKLSLESLDWNRFGLKQQLYLNKTFIFTISYKRSNLSWSMKTSQKRIFNYIRSFILIKQNWKKRLQQFIRKLKFNFWMFTELKNFKLLSYIDFNFSIQYFVFYSAPTNKSVAVLQIFILIYDWRGKIE